MRFGTAIADAGAEVWLYDVWADQKNRLASKGYTFIRIGTSATVKGPLPTCHHSVSRCFGCSPNNYSEDALKPAKPILGADTVLNTLQMGLGNIETMQKNCPGQPIIARVTNYAGDMIDRDTRIDSSGITKMKARSRKRLCRHRSLLPCSNKRSHHAELSEDVLKDIWKKLQQAGMNTVSAVTD
jgi:2-dehydropantoate 2-reductase